MPQVRFPPRIPPRRALAGLAALVVVVGALLLLLIDDESSDRSGLDASAGTSSSTTRDRTSTSGEDSSTSSTADPSTTGDAPTTGDPPTSGAPSTSGHPSTTAPPGGLAAARITLTPVASLDYPIAMAIRPTDASLWVATKGGSVCRLDGASCTASQVVAAVSTGGEQGLLGIAFDPAGTHLYASYTNPAGDSRLDEFAVRPDGTADLGSRRQVFGVDQPEANHNGGNITFGPDGHLYLGLGDGGGAGDRHGPVGNGQDPGTDLGKVLRINPASGSVERWISGVRNPWRFSFDVVTGDLWIGDVGQDQLEEVDLLPAGQQRGRNLGWRCFEGTKPYGGCTPAGGHTGPIFEYRHGPGCSITGGYVYRGTRIPALRGTYLFADYCDGELRGLTQVDGRVTAERRLGVQPGNVVSFGQDAAGELYVLTPSGISRVDPA